MRILALAVVLASATSIARADVASDIDEVLVHYRLYVDAGYLHSSTQPENRLWRSKGTDFRLDRPELNLAMALLSMDATAQSRWGFDFGLQAGVDTELAVPDDDPIAGADALQYFYRASLTYLIDRNDAPSMIGKTFWRVNEHFTYSQTLYWGPDQRDTSVEFWRFFSDSIVEYRRGALTLAFVFDIGTEKQADESGNPRGNWLAAAFWLRWEIDAHWSIGVRPEIYDDSDGVISGSRQRIGDFSVALKYRFEPVKAHTLVVSLEYRYDRSTGPEGGFYSGPNNTLVGDQHLFMVAVSWSFEGQFG